MFYDYPTDFPSSGVWQLVADALRNRTVNVKETLHAAWHVAGYGLAQWDVHPRPVGAAAPLSAEDAAALCEGQADEPAMGAAVGLPWDRLLPVVLDLAALLLRKLLGG